MGEAKDKDLEAKDAELAKDIEDLEDDLRKEFEELKAELLSEKDADVADDLRALTSEVSGGQEKMEISQHVNIDLDLGDLPKEESFSGSFDDINLEWWQYGLVGL